MKPPVIVILGESSIPVARQIQTALPEAILYGLASRSQSVDVSYANFGETVRELFRTGTPIIGICASGILIRTLAPLLANKWQEPPVLAIAEDGSAVVPLLGGLHGVNDLASQIAAVLSVSPAITTTGAIRFRTTLLSPPAGYYLANPEDAKTFISDLLAGATVKLIGEAPWLQDSNLPISPDGTLTIQITERLITPQKNCLVYHPATVAIALCRGGFPNPPLWEVKEWKGEAIDDRAIAWIQQVIAIAEIAPASIAGIFALNCDAADPEIHAIARYFNVPARFFTLAAIETIINNQKADSMVSTIALTAAGSNASLVTSLPHHPSISIPYSIALAIASTPIDVYSIGQPKGKLAIVGTGPGSVDWMSKEVREILQSTTDWVGYKTYLDLVEPLRKPHTTRHESDNRVELDRARTALDLASQGRSVALVSSGDPGIYAMAAAVFEVLERDAFPEWDSIAIQVCPGISAMQAAAACVGAPLGHDFCVISLSDILKPWEVIRDRISAAARADFAIALYNPVSKQRTWQLEKAKEILLQWRSPQTPVVVARNLGRQGQSACVKPLSQLTTEDADMQTIILIGSSKTRTIPRLHCRSGNDWVYTPRGYSDR